jgi:hypothetical protein
VDFVLTFVEATDDGVDIIRPDALSSDNHPASRTI